MKSQTNFVYRCLYVVSIREWSVLFDNISVSVVAASEIVELGKIGVECGCDWSSDSVALSPAPRSRRVGVAAIRRSASCRAAPLC